MKDNRMKGIIIVAIIFMGYYLISFLLGARTICFFKNTFGMPCPGCGMTRSTYYLLHGDIDKVMYYHPLVFLVIPYSLIILLSFKVSWAKRLVKNNFFWIFAFVIFMGFYIYRMLVLFPHTSPMDFYTDGFLPKVIRWIQSIF